MRWHGSVYERKGRTKLWIRFRDVDGRWTQKPTPFGPAERDKAERLLERVRDKILARQSVADELGGDLTVASYVRRWVQRRRDLGIDSVREEEQRLRDHVVRGRAGAEVFGDLPLAEVRRHHIRALMDDVQAKRTKRRGREAPERLAPRTVLHVYRTLRQVFRDAVRADILEANPVDLDKSELPKKVDKDPTWRAGAVFSRGEVERLISDPRVPEDRRVAYALEFLTGSRMGEVSALRWSRYEPGLEPLGRLQVLKAYNTRRRAEKETKTKRPRLVPVHPALARVLAAWKLGGWARYAGRLPAPEDLILPSAHDSQGRPRELHRHRNVGWSNNRFREDLKALGIPRRRHYDSRRTFISLAIGDGASKDLLRWVTHAPGDVFDDYNSPPWPDLCREVRKLRIRVRKFASALLPLSLTSRQ